MNNDKLTEIAFADFHKAFYVIDHNLLLKNYQGTVSVQIEWHGFNCI